MSDEDEAVSRYDFSDWDMTDKPGIDDALDGWLRDNMQEAFRLFEDGRWGVIHMDGFNDDGSVLHWKSRHYDDDDPALISIEPAMLKEALLLVLELRIPSGSLSSLHGVHREEVAEMLPAVALWREAIDAVEQQIRRIMALPAKQ